MYLPLDFVSMSFCSNRLQNLRNVLIKEIFISSFSSDTTMKDMSCSVQKFCCFGRKEQRLKESWIYVFKILFSSFNPSWISLINFLFSSLWVFLFTRKSLLREFKVIVYLSIIEYLLEGARVFLTGEHNSYNFHSFNKISVIPVFQWQK